MLTITQLEFGLSEMRSRCQQAKGQLQLLKEQLEQKQSRHEELLERIDTWRKVQVLFTKVSEYAREQLKVRIEDVVTAALQAVFEDEGLRFEIDIREVGGKPSADWKVVSRYAETEVSANPEEARGGGITDVVSLALRLALLELARPKPEGPVILDEPGKMISRDYLPNVAAFLKQYAARTGRSIIMVTHAEPLAEIADLSYRVSQRDGISEVVKGG